MARRGKKRGVALLASGSSTDTKTTHHSFPKVIANRIRPLSRRWTKKDVTVKIINAVDKIYNQETEDIERLARIYSIK